MTSKLLRAVSVFGLLLVFCASVTAQTYKDDVGFNRLQAEIGVGVLEDGSGVSVGLVEAPATNGTYMPTPPDSGDYESNFSGKTIINETGTDTGTSSHARGVALRLFGNTFSMTGGIDNIQVFEANDFIGAGHLRTGSGLDPLTTNFQVSNHSYAGRTSSADLPDKLEILQRLDHMIDRDNHVATVGTFNGGSLGDLLAPSYNAITVGISAGTGASGLTSDYGDPRFKPDLVAPKPTSSTATPVVASAAALLIQAGSGTNATQNEAVKAMLFAGATKNESEAAFSDWDRTSTRPVDQELGFGELNVYNSYMILQGGEFEASTSDPASNVGLMGYDYGDFDGSTDLFYDIEIEAESTLSAVLTWNAEVQDADGTDGFSPSLLLKNLDLELYDSGGSFLESLIDSSISTDYNHEHIYLTNLAAGNYTFRISGDDATDFGFAWRVNAVPEPGAIALSGLVLAGLAVRRRKR